MEKSCKFITSFDILYINKCVIKDTGGLFIGENNIRHGQNLELILEEIMFPIYQVDRFPTLFMKIACLIQRIICNHVFNDGNKRTALGCCIQMFFINGYSFTVDDEVEKFLISISTDKLSIENIAKFIEKKVNYHTP